MNPHDQRVIHSSEEADWRTPPALFRRLQDEFDLTVDGAADKASALCPYFFGKDTSPTGALGINWVQTLPPNPGHPRVFLNPPYSRTRLRATKDPSYDIARWAEKCWTESRAGCTVVGLFPFAPQTSWYRRWVWGQWETKETVEWGGHAAMEERRLPYRVSFLRPDGSPASNAGVNSVVIVWKPNPGYVGPWQPVVRYWSYR